MFAVWKSYLVSWVNLFLWSLQQLLMYHVPPITREKILEIASISTLVTVSLTINTACRKHSLVIGILLNPYTSITGSERLNWPRNRSI